jgi:transposase
LLPSRPEARPVRPHPRGWCSALALSIGCRRMRNTPAIIEGDRTRREEVLRRVAPARDAKDVARGRAVFESSASLADLGEDKNTSIRRRRPLFFGACTETTESVGGRASKTPGATPQPDGVADRAIAADEPETTTPDEPRRATASRGHGRHGADASRGAGRRDVPHPSRAAGDAGPACGQGTVSEKAPGVSVRITGPPPRAAKVSGLQKRRCPLGGQVFTAAAPAEAGDQKDEATAASRIALVTDGRGRPFPRLDGRPGQREVPRPASTPGDIVPAVAANVAPAFAALIRPAAQGDVRPHEETTVTSLELRGQRRRPGAPADAAREAGAADDRSGLDPSGVVAWRDGHRGALFFSGRRHAGANRAPVLEHHAAALPPPIPRGEALSRTLPGALQTILANCWAQARRQFVDGDDRFPAPCRPLLESRAVVDHNDARAREHAPAPEARLRFHHEKSETTMSRRPDWRTRPLSAKGTEPNSALGRAPGDRLRPWEKRTLFLRQAGAPRDNTRCERALKKALRHRTKALFSKARNGARVGDLFMSLIDPGALNQANPFDSLTPRQPHRDERAANPDLWMPWNYRAAPA